MILPTSQELSSARRKPAWPLVTVMVSDGTLLCPLGLPQEAQDHRVGLGHSDLVHGSLPFQE